MKIKEILNGKKLATLVITINLIVVMLILSGCAKSDSGIKTYEKENDDIANQLKNENNNSEVKDLTDIEKQLLFEKAVTANKGFIQTMIICKDFSTTEFKDEEIIKLLPILDNFYNYVVSGKQDSTAQISVADMQKLSNKHFGKSIDTNNIKKYIENDMVCVDVETGFGISNCEMVSVSQGANNEYSIKFQYIEEDKTSNYNITVLYEDGNITYKTIKLESSVTNNNVETGNNKVKSEAEKASEEIRKALKDKEWLKKNVIPENIELEELEKSDDFKLNFMCLKKENDNIPIIFIQCSAEKESVWPKLTLISYDNGKVTAQAINPGGERSIQVDPNNKIINRVINDGGKTVQEFLKVENKMIKFIEKVTCVEDKYYKNLYNEQWMYEEYTEDEINNIMQNIKNEYKIKDIWNEEYKEITKAEFESIIEKYEKYNMVSIETELNEANIDKYVK